MARSARTGPLPAGAGRARAVDVVYRRTRPPPGASPLSCRSGVRWSRLLTGSKRRALVDPGSAVTWPGMLGALKRIRENLDIPLGVRP